MRKAIKPYTTLESLTDLCKRLYEHIGLACGENEYFEYWASLPYLAHQNRLMLKSLPDDPQAACDVLDEAVSIASCKSSPMFLSYCDDITFPLGEYLKSKGMTEVFCQAGMAYLTGNVTPKQKQTVIEIGLDRLEEWCRVCDKAFGKQDDVMIYKKLLADEKCRFYACEADDSIVCTGMYCIDDFGINTGIHSIGTLPEYRGRGYAASVVSHIIAEAEKMNIPLLTLQASPLGEPVYSGLSFKKYTMIHSYARVKVSR